MKSFIHISTINYILLSLLLLAVTQYGVCVGFYPTSMADINSTNSFSYTGVSSQGISSTICDFNGDGKKDLIYYTGNILSLVYVYFGTPTSFFTDATSFDGTNGFSISGLGINLHIKCGDLNNDGYDDLVLAMRVSGDNGGKLIFIYGKTQLSSGSINVTYVDNPNNGFWVPGVGNQLIGTAKNIGDFNGDGIIDLCFGTNVGSTGNVGPEVTYMLYGINGGKFPTLPTGEFNVSILNGQNGFTINGQNNYFMGMGDINNDGLDDLIINTDQQIFNVIYGFKQNPSSPAFYVPSYDGIDSFVIQLVNASIDSNNTPLFGIGDFNGDGLNEISFNMRLNGTYAISIIYGRLAFPNIVYITYPIDSSIGFQMRDLSKDTTCSEMLLKDINGDGLADIMCTGTVFYTFSIFGSALPWPTMFNLSAPSNPLSPFKNPCKGFTLNNYYSGKSIGDLYGDGIPDIVLMGSPSTFGLFGQRYFQATYQDNTGGGGNYMNVSYSDRNEIKIFPNISLTSTGQCPLEYFKVRISNSEPGDKLSFNNSNSAFAITQRKDDEIVIASASLQDILDSPQYILLSTNRNDSLQIQLEIIGQTFNFTMDFYPSNSSSSSSSSSSTSPSSSSSSDTSSTESDDDDESDKKKAGIIAGAVVGGAVLIALVTLAVIFLIMRRKKKSKNSPSVEDTPPPVPKEVSMVAMYTGGKIEKLEAY